MRSRSRHRFFPQFGLFVLCVLLYTATASAKREHLVYFPNTAYELNIYKIHGQKIKTGEAKRVKDLFPNSSNKQTIEIKNGPMLLGSFVIEIG